MKETKIPVRNMLFVLFKCQRDCMNTVLTPGERCPFHN